RTELPEAFVATNEVHPVHAGQRRRIDRFQAARIENHRRRGVPCFFLASELLAEEMVGDEDLVDAAQSVEHQVATAAFIFQKWRTESRMSRNSDMAEENNMKYECRNPKQIQIRNDKGSKRV